jgi:DNA-binding winged helix-turn-helix (wHTH) protein
MKSFKTFRLDTANHLLWRNGERVPLAPKGFDILAYLVEHAGRVVTQDEILEALWSETYVNPEVLRKYILEIRRALGDRPNNPEFIETLPKRGYQFIGAVTDKSTAERQDVLTSHATEEQGTEKNDGPAIAPSKRESLSSKPGLWKLALVPVLLLVLLAATTWSGRRGGTASQ